MIVTVVMGTPDRAMPGLRHRTHAMDQATPPATELAPAEKAAAQLSRRERALQLMLTQRGDPSAEVDRMLAEDPHCVFSHSLRAALMVRSDEPAARATLAASVEAIEAACIEAGNPTRRHAAAARAWLDGDLPLAAERYGAIVIDRPHDILALSLAHTLDFRLGRRRMLRDRIAQILPEWRPGTPGYASVLAMYAFGLEENGQYRLAERTARRALALDPQHPGAIHVVAHVMEMNGRAAEGLGFLAQTEPAWCEGTGLSTHLAWHRALFHLEADEPDTALGVYDEQIAGPIGWDLPGLADASALLWRLELKGMDVAARWRALADRWEIHDLGGARLFYVGHAMMAFAGAGRSSAAAHLLEALAHTGRSCDLLSPPEEALAAPLCEALLAFARGDYAACVAHLMRVRHISHHCGGSLAQCDLVHLTLTEAALRTSERRLAHALVAERTAQRPASQLNRQLRKRLRIWDKGCAARERPPIC